jgi:hypothetical protein
VQFWVDASGANTATFGNSLAKLAGVAMAHDLSPKSGDRFLAPTDVVARIARAFPVHEVDAKKARDVAEKMIAQLQRMKAPAKIVESYRQRQSQVLSIYLSDDGSENSYLSFTLWPEERILIGYHSRQHEEGSRVLLERLADTLGYEITEV